jgi:IMP dehydrogenase
VPVIADGGVKRHGALMEALLFGGDCSMLGSAFAGTEEAPGEVVAQVRRAALNRRKWAVKVPFKVLRWMASLRRDPAIGSTSRTPIGSSWMPSAPRAWRSAIPARGSARTIVREMIKHICSSISYGGAASLAELRQMFWSDPRKFLIKQSASARRESYER